MCIRSVRRRARRSSPAELAEKYRTLDASVAPGEKERDVKGMATLEQPLPLDGMDMWEVFTGRKPSPRTEAVHNLPGGGTGEMGRMSICQGSWKLIDKELYDITNDPGEKTDLAVKHPDICKNLNARLLQLVAERRPPEKHLKIPDKPLLVLGEQENAHPPPWLQPYLDALPGAAKAKKAKQNQKSDPDDQ